jgi:hypothetical protein
VGPWLIKPLRIDQSEHEILHHTELTEITEIKIFKFKKSSAPSVSSVRDILTVK